MKTKYKILIAVGTVLALLVISGLSIFNGLKNFSSPSQTISNQLNLDYEKSEVIKNPATTQDKLNLINKLNSNVENIVVNEQLNSTLLNEFKFNENFEVSLGEFCWLLNIVNSYVNEDVFFGFDEIDIFVSQNPNAKYEILSYVEIDRAEINSKLNLSIDKNIIFLTKQTKNYRNITKETQLIQINNTKIQDASSQLKDLFSGLQINFFDEILSSVQDLFHCNFEFIENSVMIFA